MGNNISVKKGFNGLLNLATDVSKFADLKVKISPPDSVKKDGNEENTSNRDEHEKIRITRKIPADTAPKIGNALTTAGKWVLGFAVLIFLIIIINEEYFSANKKPYNAPVSKNTSNNNGNNSIQIKKTVVNAQKEKKYVLPPVGTNNTLSVPQLRWCARESIRIETMRDLIDTNSGVDEFNQIVGSYNSRCGSFRYREGTLEIARRDVEKERSEIVLDAINGAILLGNEQSSYDISTDYSKRDRVKKAQVLLTKLGYDPGPIDGQYGSKTKNAIKAFQRDTGLLQDGLVDESLIGLLSIKMKY